MASGFDAEQSVGRAGSLLSVKGDVLCRISPFLLYMAFIGLEQALRFLGDKGAVVFPVGFFHCLYPAKVLAVALLLLFFREKYDEITLADLRKPLYTVVSTLTGIAVFAMWIKMDFPFATLGTPAGFDPHVFRDRSAMMIFSALRLCGAVLVVPFMEELFWRSFLTRYIINSDFRRVPPGSFTIPSFLFTAVLFGSEHHLFLAGIVAGIAYNLLFYYTRSISHCIVAHAATNLALGIYVLQTGNWLLW